MRPLRICIVSQEFPPETGRGGIATQSALKARGLSARGHSVQVLSMTYAKKPTMSNEGGYVVHRIPHPALPVPGHDPSSSWLAYSAAVAAKLNELTATQTFDIFQFPEYVGEGFVWQTDTFSHRIGKYVVQMHGPLAMFSEHVNWPEKGCTAERIGCFMEQSVIHNCDQLFASSHNTAGFCSRRYGFDVDKVRVIHSGIDTDRFAPPGTDQRLGQATHSLCGQAGHTQRIRGRGANRLVIT